MSGLEICLWLSQTPNTWMQISRNKGATKKASRKMVHNNFKKKTKLFGQKGHFFNQKNAPNHQNK